MIDLEKWIEENSVTMQLNPKHRGVLVDDLRALFAGKVLCDAEPAGYRYRRPNHGTWDTYYSDTKVADSIAHMQEPLYAAAKEQ
jgi:hypothetical protein